ncbi:MAG: hypothetical protein JRJ12_13080 [Deltaproteobacteria bacterium]|nr:hypothetical protein [Deltaproteobacteria bacterium]MBW2072128.1 hypothetical protein [Deltaproteobacteria bacterium]
MALDEPRENDETFEVNGITYLVDTRLLEQAKPIKVDFVEDLYQAGFSISSNLAAASNCGGSCSC